MPLTLIHLALEARSTAELERAALAHLQSRVGMDAAFLATKRRPEAATVIGLDPARTRAVLADGARFESELAPVKRAALEARGVAVDTAVLGERRVQASAYHREVAAPIGGRHALLAYLRRRGAVTGLLLLGRCGRGFGDREIAAVEEVLAPLTVAHASFDAAPTADLEALTPREREIVGYLCLGYQNHNVVGCLGESGPVLRVIEVVRGVFGEARVIPVIAGDEDVRPGVARNVVVMARRLG